MRVLITGVTGQLGQALLRHQPTHLSGTTVECIATSRNGGDGSLSLDLSDSEACRAVVRDYQPHWVLNAGAYTAVDQAEAEPDLAHAINAGAPAAFADVLQGYGGRMLQISTDFVFNGNQNVPYQPEQLTSPLGTYGLSKAAGEQAVLNRLGQKGLAVILRTSWVYGPVGRNFLLTMLRLHAERAAEGRPLSVVSDQYGSPTATDGLAAACWRVLQRQSEEAQALPPILHWSDAGITSWYEFAVSIGKLAVDCGLLTQAADICSIPSSAYPTPAKRPPYSVLDCGMTSAVLGLAQHDWRESLADVLRNMV